MRLILAALIAAAAGTAAGLVVLFVSNSLIPGATPVSGEDLFGFGSLIPVAALALCGFLYAPGLLLLRRVRGGCEPAGLFAATSALLLNVPVVAGMFVAQALGSPFFGASEVAVFVLAFVVTGLVFGRGFVAHCRRRLRARPAGPA